MDTGESDHDSIMAFTSPPCTLCYKEKLGTMEKIEDAIAARKSEVLRLLTLRNSHVAINRRLPPELLSQIFLQIARSYDYQHDRQDRTAAARSGKPAETPVRPNAWISIVQVCRYWRDVALNFPLLWTIVVDKRPERLDAFVERSRQAPLVFRPHFTDRDHTETIMRTLLTQRHRIKSLDFDMILTSWEVLVDAPLLEELRLVYSVAFPADLEPPVFVLPRLRKVLLMHTTFAFARGIVQRETITELQLTETFPLQTPAAMLEMLRHLPALEVLELVNTLISEEGTTLSSFPTQMSFPRLRWLRIVEDGVGSACAYILGALDIPSTASISFLGTLPPTLPESAEALVRHLLAIVARRSTDPTCDFRSCRLAIQIPIRNTSIVIASVWKTHVPAERLAKDIPQSTPSVAVKWRLGSIPHNGHFAIRSFLDIFPLSKVQALYHAGSIAHSITPEHFQKLRSVQDLVLDYWDHLHSSEQPSDRDVLAALASPDGDASPSTRFAFPNLKHLIWQHVTWNRHPPDHPKADQNPFIHVFRDALLRRRDAGLPVLRRLVFSNCANVGDYDILALTEDGLVKGVEQYDSAIWDECSSCYPSEDDDEMDDEFFDGLVDEDIDVD